MTIICIYAGWEFIFNSASRNDPAADATLRKAKKEVKFLTIKVKIDFLTEVFDDQNVNKSSLTVIIAANWL